MPTNLRPISSPYLRAAIKTALLALLCVAGASCGQSQASTEPPAIPMEKVMQAIREYGQGHKATPASAPVSMPTDVDTVYEAHINTLVLQNDFAQLEHIAHQIREDKSRVVGGTWKVAQFYDGTGIPHPGANLTVSDYPPRIEILKRWVAAYPESAAARLSLANSYLSEGMLARGTEYAKDVSESQWVVLNTGMARAKELLLEAALLKEKDPIWYELWQNISLYEGWDKEQARELLEQAVAFEPDYYHYYREYANYVRPQWYGEEGEILSFAKGATSSLPEPRGSITYFEITSLLACYCGDYQAQLAPIDWPRAKEGYANIKRLYGMSNLKANRYSVMAVALADKPAARDAFESATTFEPGVWSSSESFEFYRNLASMPYQAYGDVPLRPTN
jgi:tetratricopeptide (TPR) repeat protein